MRIVQLTYFILLLSLFATPFLASSKDVNILEKNYLAVWNDGNSKLAEKVLHPDYHYVGADGERHTRQWTIDMIASGRLIYSNVEISRGLVHQLGDTLVTIGTLKAPGFWDGKPMVDHLAFTMVWVRSGDAWLLLSEHNSRIRKP